VTAYVFYPVTVYFVMMTFPFGFPHEDLHITGTVEAQRLWPEGIITHKSCASTSAKSAHAIKRARRT